MHVVIFYPANVKLLIYTIESGCELRENDFFYVDENKTEIFNPYDFLRDCNHIDIKIFNVDRTESQLSKKETFSTLLNDPVCKKSATLEIEQINGNEVKFFIEQEGKFYRLNESTWPEMSNTHVFKNAYAFAKYTGQEFMIEIIRKMPEKITSFDKFNKDDKGDDAYYI